MSLTAAAILPEPKDQLGCRPGGKSLILLFVILSVLVLGIAVGTYVTVKQDRPAKAPDSPLRPEQPAG